MLTTSVLEGTQIVAATYSGSLRTEEMTTLREQIERVIAEHGQARLLLEYGDIDLSRIEPRAMWEDLKTAGVLGDVDRIAVLTDARWLQKVTGAAQTVTPAEVQVYDADRRTDAEHWLRGQPRAGD